MAPQRNKLIPGGLTRKSGMKMSELQSSQAEVSSTRQMLLWVSWDDWEAPVVVAFQSAPGEGGRGAQEEGTAVIPTDLWLEIGGNHQL